MALTIKDASKWLSSSPAIEDINKALNSINLKISDMVGSEHEQGSSIAMVTSLLESAIEDLDDGRAIESYKELVLLFEHEKAPCKSNNMANVDCGLLCPDISADDMTNLNGEEKKVAFNKLKLELSNTY